MILIDPPVWPAHGTTFSHLVSDVSLEELHGFAQAHHIHPRAFDLDHYDIPAESYAALVAGGARPVRAKELVQRLISSGLRVRKHLHRGLPATRNEEPGPGVGSRAQ